MTQSIPDDFPAAISIDALERLHKSATTEASAQPDGSEDYQLRIERISAEILKDMSERLDDPMIPKLVVLRLLHQMAGWAIENQQAAGEHNDLGTFATFTAMAAQLSSASIAVQNIFMSNEDFTHPLNNEDDDDKQPA